MTLKDDLIRIGYLPENLPPPFHTEAIAQHFLDNPSGYLSDGKQSLRSANYSASKRGISRRAFSAVHPITAHDLAEFFQVRAPELDKLFEGNTSSYSVPRHAPDSERALEIASHTRLEVGRLTASEHRREERLRAALEYAFDLSLSESDDGILKYAIRQLDLSEHDDWDEWSGLQPFLMRSAIHFGHTLDYVVRVLVWRKLTHDDLDEVRWQTIIETLLDRHGRLGNDSEVCWLIFAAIVLKIAIPTELAAVIIRNCGALSVVGILNHCSADKGVFDAAFEVIGAENADGAMWPVFLEWGGTGWNRSGEIKKLIKNDVVRALVDTNVFLFDYDRLTRVFKGVEPSRYSDVTHAIETRISSYDDETKLDDQQA